MNDAYPVVSFRNGDHICLFYRSIEEQLLTAVPFVKLGLLRDERCLCVLPKAQGDLLLRELDRCGAAVEEHLRRGALLMKSPEETYLASGTFDRDQMIELLDDAMREALALGFNGFRATGDVTWAARDGRVCLQLAEYEQMLDSYFPGKLGLGICMYDARAFSPQQLNQILNAHRLALMDPSPITRSLRIRKGKLFGDVVFDRISPSLFHYTVQTDSSSQLITVGQENTLPGAIAAVESALS